MKREENIFYPFPEEIQVEIKSLKDSFNFGLYFNKWLYLKEKEGVFKCDFSLNRNKRGLPAEVLGNFKNFKKILKTFLDKKYKEIDLFCEAMRKLGYEVHKICSKLETTLIIGLGNSHPTERGFTFHWTLGIPYIPSNAIKGILRDLCEKEELKKELFGNEPGSGEALRGKVVLLDAFPLEIPELTLEITTCHYPNYYKDGEQGPTEDQHPRPLLFLAIKPGVRFNFVYLFAKELSSEQKEYFENIFQEALTEHGLGGKTTLGHGIFKNY